MPELETFINCKVNKKKKASAKKKSKWKDNFSDEEEIITKSGTSTRPTKDKREESESVEKILTKIT